MAGTAVSFNGVTTAVFKGNVRVAPGTSITVSLALTYGYLEANSANAQSCSASMFTTYNAAKATSCLNTATPADLANLTLQPGVYCTGGGAFTLSAGKLILTGLKVDV